MGSESATSVLGRFVQQKLKLILAMIRTIACFTTCQLFSPLLFYFQQVDNVVVAVVAVVVVAVAVAIVGGRALSQK